MKPEIAVGARAGVLGRIRQALHLGSTEPIEDDVVAQAWAAVPREYRQVASRDRDAVLALFEDRLRDYDAHVERCQPPDLPAVVERLLALRGSPRMLVPAGLPAEWLPPSLVFTSAAGLGTSALDGFDGVVTGATLAIAETGTLVLQSVPGQGPRSATLVPDYHLCIVHSRDVVETVPEAIRRLVPTATLPTTFVSGPSATADIEMTRIKGVHGPRFLDVVLLDEPR